MTLNYDLIADLIIYAFSAWFAYVIFSMSQVFRLQYIEQMGHSIARLINKSFEYSALFMSGITLVFLSDYHGILYYLGDLILAAFLIRRFIKSDQLQRSEYLRRYNQSKHKLMNRMVINLSYYPTHHDN